MVYTVEFPPIENANKDGLVAVGGDLDITTLRIAYNQGIFPWPISEEYPIAWFSPDPRGIIEVNDLHIPKSLKKFLGRTTYKITFNQAFNDVIWECQNQKRKDQEGTWITDSILDSFTQLFYHGLAYSVETWDGKNLVGGIYGLVDGNIISGESMFYKSKNASKIALIHLISHLKDKNIPFIDTQMVTPVIRSLGGKEIPRTEYMNKLLKLKESPSQSIF